MNTRKPTDRSARRRGAFTLLEIMMAVAILAIIAGAIYQFTDVTLQSAQFYTQVSDQEAINSGFRRLFEAQLAAVPLGMQGAMLGIRSHGRDGEHDSLQLVCPPGNGVLSPDARGNYEVLMEVREWPRRSGKYVLGIERRPHDDDDDDDDDEDVAAAAKVNGTNPLSKHVNLPADWVPLIEGVRTLELSYFDSRLNGWVEKWVDPAVLPNLVRVRFAADSTQAPYEFVASVPAGGIRQGVPTFIPPPVAGQAGTNLRVTPSPPRAIPSRQ